MYYVEIPQTFSGNVTIIFKYLSNRSDIDKSPSHKSNLTRMILVKVLVCIVLVSSTLKVFLILFLVIYYITKKVS